MESEFVRFLSIKFLNLIWYLAHNLPTVAACAQCRSNLIARKRGKLLKISFHRIKITIKIVLRNEDCGTRSRHLKLGLVMASHRVLWGAITYPCLRYLPASGVSPQICSGASFCASDARRCTWQWCQGLWQNVAKCLYDVTSSPQLWRSVARNNKGVHDNWLPIPTFDQTLLKTRYVWCWQNGNPFRPWSSRIPTPGGNDAGTTLLCTRWRNVRRDAYVSHVPAASSWRGCLWCLDVGTTYGSGWIVYLWTISCSR